MKASGRLVSADIFLKLMTSTSKLTLGQLLQQAQACLGVGDLQAALHACSTLLEQYSGNAAVHWVSSRAFRSARLFRLAVFHARQSARCLSRNSSTGERLLVIQALISAGEYEVALRLLGMIDKTAMLSESDVLQAAELTGMLDNPALVLEWVKLAEANGHSSSNLAFLKGNSLRFLGDFAGAEGAYEEAIRLAPHDAYSHLALATLGATGRNSSRVDRVRVALSRVASEDAEVALRFALFRELDGLGDFDSAWGELKLAMDMKRRLVDYLPGNDAQIFDRLDETYTSDFMSGHGADCGDRIPIFIFGMPRVGTTLLERMLGNHAQVAACGELSELRMSYKWSSDYYCNGFLDPFSASKLKQADANLVGSLYRNAVSWRVGGKKWFTDKHPGNLLFSGLILRSLPEARVIHVRRDAADTCFSNMKELFARHYYEYSYGMTDVADYYLRYDRLLRQVQRFAPGRVLEVQYEELVTNPESVLRRVLRYCDLPLADGLSDVTQNSGAVTTASSVQVRKAVNTVGISAWRRYERHLDPMLQSLAIAD